MTPSRSEPPELFAELTGRHGVHPLLDADSLAYHDPADIQRFLSGLASAVPRRAAILLDLLKRQRWSLLLGVLGEYHCAQHYLWHTSQPHSVQDRLEGVAADPLLQVFQDCDETIGKIAAAMPSDGTLALCSLNGSHSNNTHLGANVFLPEMLFRLAFPGRKALGLGQQDPLPLPKARMADQSAWWYEVWHRRNESNPLKAALRSRVPEPWFNRLRLERLSGRADDSPLLYRPPLFWLPASWYQAHWPTMAAFALPSASDGYVRLNVVGRDPHGMVEPDDYHQVCDRICDYLGEYRDARKGERLVRRIIRTRRDPLADGPAVPDADLVVLFDEGECPADAVIHPRDGLIGPMPHYLSGGHYASGFFLARGPSIPAGAAVHGDVTGITRTLLSLMGAPIPDYMDGTALHFE